MKQKLNNIILLIKYYDNIIALLKCKGISSVKIFNFKNWHHGYAYFYGYKNTNKVFIKVDTNFLLLQNDLLVYKLANNKLKEYLINIEDSIIHNNIQIIVYEFIEFQELTNEILKEKKYLSHIMLKIVNILNDLEIIHRDIKLDNFILIDDKLKIIDFTFAISNNERLGFKELQYTVKNCATLEFLGNGLNPEQFIWNDLYALGVILNTKLANFDINSKRQTYKIECPKIYFKIRNIKISIKKLLGIDIAYRDLKNG